MIGASYQEEIENEIGFENVPDLIPEGKYKPDISKTIYQFDAAGALAAIEITY